LGSLLGAVSVERGLDRHAAEFTHRPPWTARELALHLGVQTHAWHPDRAHSRGPTSVRGLTASRVAGEPTGCPLEVTVALGLYELDLWFVRLANEHYAVDG
jgi:hypothetical protein